MPSPGGRFEFPLFRHEVALTSVMLLHDALCMVRENIDLLEGLFILCRHQGSRSFMAIGVDQ